MEAYETSLLDVELDNDDHHLTLTDGTMWFVNPRDLSTVEKWAPPAVLVVECCVDNTLFPYKLTHKDENITVLAMKIS